MNLSDARMKLSASANIAAPAGTPHTRGSIHLGLLIDTAFPDAAVAWQARLWIPSSAGVNLETGVVSGTLGTAQVETATVVAAAGATSSGSLSMILTSAAFRGGMPTRTVSVTLSPAQQPTAAHVAEAIRAALRADPEVTGAFRVGGTGTAVRLTALFARANDAGLNLAIPGGHGVTAAPTSANTTAGAAGLLIERLGGDGKDIFAGPLPTVSTVYALAITNSDPATDLLMTCDAEPFPALRPGGSLVVSHSAMNGVEFVGDGDPVVVDVFLIGK